MSDSPFATGKPSAPPTIPHMAMTVPVDPNALIAVEGMREMVKAVAEAKNQQEQTERVQIVNKTRQMEIESSVTTNAFNRSTWLFALMLVLAGCALFKGERDLVLMIVSGIIGYLAGSQSGQRSSAKKE